MLMKEVTLNKLFRSPMIFAMRYLILLFKEAFDYLASFQLSLDILSLSLVIKYGKNTVKTISNAFCLWELNLKFRFCSEFPGVITSVEIVKRKNKKSRISWSSAVNRETNHYGKQLVNCRINISLLSVSIMLASN